MLSGEINIVVHFMTKPRITVRRAAVLVSYLEDQAVARPVSWNCRTKNIHGLETLRDDLRYFPFRRCVTKNLKTDTG